MFTQSRPKKTGRHPRVWTDSQRRELVRLVDIGTPWKGIPALLEDKETGFAPQRGNCYKEWKKFAKMNPSELQVSDPLKKRHKINRAIRAFVAYTQRKVPAQNEHLEPSNIQLEEDSTVPTSPTIMYPENNVTQSKLTPNTSTVPQLSHVATPTDSIAEMQTPKFNNEFVIPVEKSDPAAWPSLALEQAQTIADNIITDNQKKRPAPSDMSSFHLKRQNHRVDDGARSGMSSFQAQSESGTGGIISAGHDPGANTGPGGEPSSRINSELSAIAKVEDEMGVPRGFLGFIKRLSISRNSVVSAISSSGSIGTPWSRQFRQRQPDTVQSVPEEKQNIPFPQQASQAWYQNEWDQFGPPTGAEGQAHMGLFRVLRFAQCEQDIAIQVKDLINHGANPNARDAAGETPLHVALSLGNLPACEALLEGGADVHVITPDGRSLEAYGRAVERRRGHNLDQYAAIKACRKAIFEHPEMKSKKKSKKVPERFQNITHDKEADENDYFSNEDGGGPSRQGAWYDPGEGHNEPSPAPHLPKASPLSSVECGVRGTSSGNISLHNYRGGRSSVGNRGAHHSINTGVTQHPQRGYEISNLSYSDQTSDRSLGRSSAPVRERVELWERNLSLNSSPVLQNTQNVHLDGRHCPGSSTMQQSSAIQSHESTVPMVGNRHPPGSTPTYMHRRTSNILHRPPYISVDQQSGSYAVNDPENVPHATQGSWPHAQLSGYLQRLPTGQMALVCPLSEDDQWRYMEQELENGGYSQAAIQIVAPPAMVQASPVVIEQPFDTNIGTSSAHMMPQVSNLPPASTAATPTWHGAQPRVPSSFLGLRSNNRQNTRPNLLTASARQAERMSSDTFFHVSDFLLPGFRPPLI